MIQAFPVISEYKHETPFFFYIFVTFSGGIVEGTNHFATNHYILIFSLLKCIVKHANFELFNSFILLTLISGLESNIYTFGFRRSFNIKEIL